MTADQLNRFLQAQETSYAAAYEEIKAGRKHGHWMWYIFPQLKGLGFSEISNYYGIRDLSEARSYLSHPILGSRLVDICNLLLSHETKTAREIFGTPDDLKLCSSMTLFASLEWTDQCFQSVMDVFCAGQRDEKTLNLLRGQYNSPD